MYPKNAASPPRIAVGSIYLIADGSKVVADAAVVVRAEGGAEGAGGGTLVVGATSGIWYYTPTQAETNYTAFAVTVYKASCTTATVTVVTTESAVSGRTSVDLWAGTAVVLSSGFPKITVGSMDNDVLVDSAINTGAFTADAFAANAFVAATFMAACLNGKGDWNTVVPDAAGVAPTAAEIKTAIEAAGSSIALILADTGELQTDDIPGTLATLATAAKLLAYVQLLARSDTGIGGDKATELAEINADEGSGAGDYSQQTDSIEAGAEQRTIIDTEIVTIDGIVDAIVADTNELQTNQGNWLTAVGFSTHNAAGVKTALEADGSKLDHLWEMTEDDAGVRRLTTNALEQGPGGGSSVTHLLKETTITVTDQTHFTLAAGSADNDAYKDQTAVLIDQADGNQVSTRKITAYVGATKTVTLDSAADFTIVTGDTIRIFAVAPGTTQKYPADGSVLVAPADTDAARGTALVAAYAAAASLTPGGVALSITNRARVLIPPGRYELTATLDLDTNYVDLIATEPEMGGFPQPADDDLADGTTSLNQYRPSKTEVYSVTDDTTTIEQSAADVRLVGFSIAQLSGDSTDSYHAFHVTAASNAGSRYEKMYFWCKAVSASPTSPGTPGTWKVPVAFDGDVDGVWIDCIANSAAWRIAWDVGNAAQFKARMDNCWAGGYSFIGDYATGALGTHEAVGCYLRNCHSVGNYHGSGSGYGAFGGCSTFGTPIDSDCVFIDCTAGDRAFGLGATCAGSFYRCRGGDRCFGSTIQAAWAGDFSGYAEDCTAGQNSFGGTATVTGQLSGTLVRCVGLRASRARVCAGATIEGCLLTTDTVDTDCLLLLDGTSRIMNSTILVVEGGTGVPINADAAQNVAAAGNCYNNLAVAAQGLGSDVTNVGTADGVPLTAAERAAIAAYLDEEIAAILEDTSELQTNQGAWATATGFSTLDAAGIRAAVGMESADLDTQLDAVSVTFTPVAVTVSAGAITDNAITVYENERFGPFLFTIVDSDDEPVDLSEADLEFRVYDLEDRTNVLWTVNSSGTSLGTITVGGDDNNQVTVTDDDDDNTQTPGVFRYVLWDITTEKVRARGVLTIEEEAGRA